MKTRILIIDNDSETLQRYKKTLEPHSNVWEAIYHESTSSAIDWAKDNAPEVVICDYKLNEGSGIDVLREISEIAPDSQCFITAANEDKEPLEEHIGSLYQFLPKPCDESRLITEIQGSLAIESWLGNQVVKDIVAKMGEFPSLPPMYLKVTNALNSRNASAQQIGHAISGDLAISAKVLQVVNSSYYGLEEKISDITQAVSILGIEAVRNLVLAIHVFGKFGHSPDQKALTDKLWHHSMSVGVTAKRITLYETGNEEAAEAAYTAGLLHDIGKLVMLSAIPEEFDIARAKAREENIPSWQAENEVIGCNHAETGAYVLGRWGMPAEVVEAVASHHTPFNSDSDGFSQLSAVHAANALVWERQNGDSIHPDSIPDENFLAEIGKGASWEEWHEVASGKLTHKRRDPRRADSSRESSSSAGSSGNSEWADETAATTVAAAAVSGKPSKSSSSLPIALSLVACIGVAATIFLISESSNTEPEMTIYAEETPIEFKNWAIDEPEVTVPEEEVATEVEEPAVSGEPIVAEAPIATEEPIVEETLDVEMSETADQSNEIEEEIAPEPETSVAESTPEPTPLVAELPEPQLPEQLFPDINLGGIFYNADNPLASVNGKIRRVGDSVNGAQVVRIEQKLIVMMWEDEVRTYKLK